MRPGTQTEKKPGNPLPNLSMYEVPGHGPATAHDYQRYLRSKANYDEAIKAEVEKQGVEQNNSLLSAIKNIEYVSEHKRAALVKEGLGNSNPEVQKFSAYMIAFVPADQRAPLREQVAQIVKSGLASSDLEVLENSAYMMEYAPKDQIVTLIKSGLASSNTTVQRQSASIINCAPMDERANLIKSGLASPSYEVRRWSAHEIIYVPESKDQQTPLREQVAQIVKDGLISNNLTVQVDSILMIKCAPKDQQDPLREQVVQVVKSGLLGPDLIKRYNSAYLIDYLPEYLQAPLRQQVAQIVKDGLVSLDPEIQKTSASVVDYAPGEMLTNLREQVIKAGLAKYLIQPPLYKKKDVDNTIFSRAQFEKDGSELTLLGGGLKDKTVMRRITAKAFVAWQKVFEDSKLWQDHGFDYVPIEPIQSFVLNKDGTVSVYCGVLDLSLNSWKRTSSLFEEGLTIQTNRIKSVLRKHKFVHGHDHTDNFCLKFYRDSEGNPDFTREPRIYLIDFDQAVS